MKIRLNIILLAALIIALLPATAVSAQVGPDQICEPYGYWENIIGKQIYFASIGNEMGFEVSYRGEVYTAYLLKNGESDILCLDADYAPAVLGSYMERLTGGPPVEINGCEIDDEDTVILRENVLYVTSREIGSINVQIPGEYRGDGYNVSGVITVHQSATSNVYDLQGALAEETILYFPMQGWDMWFQLGDYGDYISRARESDYSIPEIEEFYRSGVVSETIQWNRGSIPVTLTICDLRVALAPEED